LFFWGRDKNVNRSPIRLLAIRRVARFGKKRENTSATLFVSRWSDASDG